MIITEYREDEDMNIRNNGIWMKRRKKKDVSIPDRWRINAKMHKMPNEEGIFEY